MQPVIKWAGSKRSQAKTIASMIPSHRRYFEPFVGGGSIVYTMGPDDGVCGDVCAPLIDLYNEIKAKPAVVLAQYRSEWDVLQRVGQDHFYVVRDRFNANQNPQDLLFLSRTCVNGLIRFNAKGEFNNSFHLSRPGIHPDRLGRIIADWSERLQNTTFLHGDYADTTQGVSSEDFVYLDPPYANTVGRYQGTSTIDFAEFFEWLGHLNSKEVMWALSFDGLRGDKSYDSSVPTELYQRKLMLDSGHSSFRRVMGGSLEPVKEALYLNY